MLDRKYKENDDKADRQDQIQMKVKIDDQISKIFTYGAFEKGKNGKIDGLISTIGKAVEDTEKTFRNLFTKNNQEFSLTFAEAGGIGGEPKMWRRFKMTNSSWHVSMHSTDSVIFIPKRDIMFYGYGILSSMSGRDLSFNLQWHTGENGAEFSSPKYKVEFKNDDRDPDHKWWSFDIRSVGETPFMVKEGQELHVNMTLATNDSTTIYSGHGGSRHNYSVFEDQPYDFEMRYSRMDNNGTSEESG